MSVKPFEKFLVECLLRYIGNNVQAGARYQFKSPDDENSSRLHSAFTDYYCVAPLDFNGQKLFYVEVQGVLLIPVMHGADVDGFTENYISHLRDKVASQSGIFKNTALFYIHNSMLDTLINSAMDVAGKGAVWSPYVFQGELQALISHASPHASLSNFLLQDQLDSILDEGATVFGFTSIYKSLSDGVIEFKELGLFNDPIVLGMTGQPAQIKRRLDENRALRREIEFSVLHYGDQLDSALPKFSQKFIKDNFEGATNWRDVDFGVYEAELDSNKAPKLVLDKINIKDCTYFERAKSGTKAGQRDVSLLLIRQSTSAGAVIQLDFSGTDLKESEIKITQSSSELSLDTEVSKSGGKSRARLVVIPTDNVAYFSIEIRRSNRTEEYRFRCLMVEGGLFDFSGFKNYFKVEPSKKLLTLQLDENKVTVNSALNHVWSLKGAQDIVDCSSYGIVDFDVFANQTDVIQFWLSKSGSEILLNIEGATVDNGVTTPLLFDRERYTRLFKDDGNGEYNSAKRRIIVNNSEHGVSGLRGQLLDFEDHFVSERVLHKSPESIIVLNELVGNFDELHKAYADLFGYYDDHKTLPSLCAWGDEYRKLVQVLLNSYETALAEIKLNKVLTASDRSLLHIGCHTSSEGCERLSSIHPLILSYHLSLVNEIILERDAAGTLSFYDLPEVTLERLSASGLLPYTYHSESDYANLVPVKDNPFWIDIVPQRKSSNSFVRRLVKDKISEFTQAYARLFTIGNNSRLIVNAINQAQAEELFLGIVDFFNFNSLGSSCSLHVNFYDRELSNNYFDLFSEAGSYDKAHQLLGLKPQSAKSEADALIDLVRSRVTYSKFETSATPGYMEYAHLAFFNNDVPVDKQEVNIDTQLSGVLCNGLICGEAAETNGHSYFTAFGLRDVDTSGIQSLRIARLLGVLWKPSRHANAQYLGNGIGLAVSADFKDLLTCSYDSALWTTIIDPKVTLDFFANQKDVVLIHYSDQYTSSAGYDAITVTKQIELFQRLIKTDSSVNSDRLLSEFNAFNGEWLLKMMTASPKDRKEKHGIIGAYKFVSAMLRKSEICWVPLSVAEMIRVSGNVGLKMSESEFSRRLNGYKKGAISDDVLFVGFHASGMYLLPLEVKTGARPDFEYAAQQAAELKRYLVEEVLGPDTLAGKLYRSLFARQIFIQLEKFNLYQVCTSQKTDDLLANRHEWLSGDYLIKDLIDYPDGFTMAHVDSDCCFGPSYKMREPNILQIELPYSLLGGLIAAESSDEMDKLVLSCKVPSEYVLSGDNSVDAADHAVHMSAVTVEDDPSIVAPEMQQIQPPVQSTESTPKSLTVLFGHDAVQGRPLIWEPTNTSKFMNTNTGIIGTMGTGKTQFNKSLITQLIRGAPSNVDGAPIGLLIFDYKSDYVDQEFVTANSVKSLKLYRLPFNPLSLHGSMPMLPVHTANAFSETLAQAFGLGQKQQLRLRKIILEAYENAGIITTDSSTWTKACPTVSMVWDRFLAQEKVEEDSLYAALDSLATYEIFESDPQKVSSLYDTLNGVIVIELAGYSPQIQNLVVALTLDLFYAQMQKNGKPTIQGDYRQITKMILVDEADNFMKEDFQSLRKVLKEGREYGVGVILSTQDITHFKTGENNYASYILTWVIHRVAEIRNADVKALFNKDDKGDQERLMEEIRKLDKHYSLYVDGDKKVVKMRDHAFWELELG
ncbi:DNA phosphorothioation-dependent restriction protein DptH [Pseudomonas sp. B2021]|uniref:DNA phosphorothioation-dependent restriction protein DptH n=1 Tax=Pseudomonas sp. B2021 TaxID=2546445 RepID=UPI001BAF1342|nr:DNA phosphorothioation-dependent restriction protein DptH [Pseudomonas sp. B2021]MBR7215881.1 DNA phosphorothioation-dependent restriction protein DptH [Pseudomonas sp. B2021]